MQLTVEAGLPFYRKTEMDACLSKAQLHIHYLYSDHPVRPNTNRLLGLLFELNGI